jgi:thymidylate synthase
MLRVYFFALEFPCLSGAATLGYTSEKMEDLRTESAPAPSSTDGACDGEMAYLALLSKLLAAPLRQNRTGIPTRGTFHEVLKFSLYDSARGCVLPLITTKRMLYDKIYHELVWFIRGDTDIVYLQANGVNIWNANTTREFLDARGLTNYRAGQIGPGYGFQWRNYGAGWSPDQAEACSAGIDQLSAVIDQLRADPWDRRMLVLAWNPAQLSQVALPPCHYSYQFHVEQANDGAYVLNCLVNMRSADLALGVPFNIASYGLLTHFVAKITGYRPGVLSLSMADCHIYTNHEAGIREQLRRAPYPPPSLAFSDRVNERKKIDIDDFAQKFTIDDVIVSDYRHHPYIRLAMAV